MLDKTQLAIELVHGIDALEAERARLIAPLDAKISAAKHDLATLIGGRLPRVTPTPRTTSTPGRKGIVGKQLCELIVSAPDGSQGARAAEIYGEDTAVNRAKLRSLFRNLRRAGRVRQAESGLWEVVTAP